MRKFTQTAAWLVLGSAVTALFSTSVHAVCHSVAQDSELLFIASFEEQEVTGAFGNFSVTLDSLPGDPAQNQMEVLVDVTSADMDDDDFNEAIAEADWFHFAAHPQAVFRSSDVQQADTGSYLARGELDLKGIVRAISVPFKWLHDGDQFMMTGALVLVRNHFDIGSGEWSRDDSIGQAVRVHFRVRMSCDAPP